MTAARKPEPCATCRRAPVAGCSHVACPTRKAVTAQARGVSAGLSGGLRAYDPNRFGGGK